MPTPQEPVRFEDGAFHRDPAKDRVSVNGTTPFWLYDFIFYTYEDEWLSEGSSQVLDGLFNSFVPTSKPPPELSGPVIVGGPKGQFSIEIICVIGL